MLFLLGIAYGVIVIHLHDDRRVAPVKIESIERYSPWYLATWGVAGTILGSLLPWVDTLWEETMQEHRSSSSRDMTSEHRPKSSSSASNEEEGRRPRGRDSGADLTPVIRGIGAFVGIAFAIVSKRS